MFVLWLRWWHVVHGGITCPYTCPWVLVSSSLQVLLSYQEQRSLLLITGCCGHQVSWQIGSNPNILQAGKQITRADSGRLEEFFFCRQNPKPLI